VLSFLVQQRREIGVRSLWARGLNVRWLFVRRGLCSRPQASPPASSSRG
jgi:hypothetical protein